MIGLAKWERGLYVLDCDPSSLDNYFIPPIVMSISFTDSVLHVSFDDKEVFKMLWYYRLGHLCIPCLHKFKHNNS